LRENGGIGTFGPFDVSPIAWTFRRISVEAYPFSESIYHPSIVLSFGSPGSSFPIRCVTRRLRHPSVSFRCREQFLAKRTKSEINVKGAKRP